MLAKLFGETVEIAGRYRLGEQIGRGGLGFVHRARDLKLDRDVALKFPRGATANPEIVADLEREAKVLARLQHPNIVAVYDVGESEQGVYLAMELIDGVSMSEWLSEGERTWQEVVEVMRAAGEGLAAAHEAGVVHRDFKPSNVMIDNGGRVRVVDFGLAREFVDETTDDVSASSSDPRKTSAAGTVPYMAPEQFGGLVSAASDQFAFCTALFEGVCGDRPWESRTRGIVDGRSRSNFDRTLRKAGLSEPVRRALCRGVAAAPSDRYSTLRELLGELAPKPRHTWLWAVTAVVVAGGSFWAATRTEPCKDRGVAASSYATRATAVLQELGDEGDAAAAVQSAADAWNSLDERTCIAHADERLSATLFELRSRCLERALLAGDAAVEAVSSGDYPLSDARRAFAETIDVARCEDDEGLLIGAADVGYDVEAGESIQRAIDRAHVFHRLGDDARWLRELEKTRDGIVDRQAVLPDALWLAMQLGDALVRANRLDDAHGVLMSALLEAKQHPKWSRTAAMLQVQLAKVAVLRRDFEKAELWISLARPTLAVLPQQQHLYAATVVHASVAAAADRFSDALALAKEADAVAAAAAPESGRWVGVDVLEAELDVVRCAAHSGLGKQEKALRACGRALAAFDLAGARSGRMVASALNTHAVALKRARDFPAAVSEYERAAAMYEEAGFGQGAATVRINVANLLDGTGDHEGALAAYAAAERALDGESDSAWISLHFNRGIAHFGAENWDAAARDAREALRRADALGTSQPSDLYDYEVLLGTAEAKRGKVEVAREILERALRHENETHDPYSKAEARLALALLSDGDDATQLLDAARVFAEKSGDEALLRLVLKTRRQASRGP